MSPRAPAPYAALLWRRHWAAPELHTVTAETPDYYEVEVRDADNWDLPIRYRRLPRPEWSREQPAEPTPQPETNLSTWTPPDPWRTP